MRALPDIELFRMLRDPSFARSLEAEAHLMTRLRGLDTTLDFVAGGLKAENVGEMRTRAESIEKELRGFHSRVRLLV